MPSHPREATITAGIIQWLNRQPHTYARKVHSSLYSSGWPDIIGTHQGRTLALEVKTPSGKVTALQEHELAKWKMSGAIAAVVRSVADVQAVLSENF